jgi:hypothetical protein
MKTIIYHAFKTLLPVALFAAVTSFSYGDVATVRASGLIDVLPLGARDAKGKLIQAGLSAAVFDGDKVIIANDRDIVGDRKSAIFSIEYETIEELIDYRIRGGHVIPEYDLTFMDEWIVKNGTKYESITRSSDGQHIIVSTAFNSLNSSASSRSRYSCLMSWKKHIPDGTQLAYPTVKEYVLSSDDLRRRISKAMATEEHPDGIPYFNMEGMTTLEGDKILFGIRQYGPNHVDTQYAVKIIQGTYSIDSEQGFLLNDDLEVVYDLDPKGFKGIAQELALSSLEYDADNDQLYILTSYETGDNAEDIGSYLWVIGLDDMYKGVYPRPITNAEGQPIHFGSKMEGAALLPEGFLFVVADDDKVLDADFPREQNQAGFYILELHDEDVDVESESNTLPGDKGYILN